MKRNRLHAQQVWLVAAAFAWNAVASAAPCDSPDYRVFDFWLGEWNVHGPAGKLAGRNSIKKEYGGCVLHERYENDSGYRGESLNTFDPGRGVWHQTWVDNSGLLLVIEGKFQDGKMVLHGETKAADGKVTKHRITWAPNADGGLRQLWESTDAKGDWAVTFDGKYTRK